VRPAGSARYRPTVDSDGNERARKSGPDLRSRPITFSRCCMAVRYESDGARWTAGAVRSSEKLSFSSDFVQNISNVRRGLLIPRSQVRSLPLVHGAPPATNSVLDPGRDATFDANGLMSQSQRNLDILASSIASRGKRLRITLKIADLRSLKPDTSSRNHDNHLVWLVQWFSPSTTDSHGGKNSFAYMESARGRRPTFWVGESARAQLPATAPGLTYPGVKRVTGSYTRTAPGTITIDVPVTAAYARNPVSSTLYHVTASTMTLAGPANRPAPFRAGAAYIGGSFFNLIDSAPSYDFIP
jgi:hypothetical protein